MPTAIWMIALAIAVFIAVIAWPSEYPTWFAPHRRWGENLGFLYDRFLATTRKRKALLGVFGSIGVAYLIVPATKVGMLSTDQAVWTMVLASLICAVSSISLLWREYRLRTRLADYSRGFELMFAAASFLMLVAGKSIADNEIQLLTHANPEEFSTASNALAAVYALWFWVFLCAIIMIPLALSPMIFLLKQRWPWSWQRVKRWATAPYRWSGQKTAFDSVEQLAILLGFYFSAVMLSGMSGSDWAVRMLKQTTVYIVVKTSFFQPDDETKQCMREGFDLIRIIGDGDRVLLTNGTDFESFKCDIVHMKSRRIHGAREHRQ
jgi:hypothetical protein